MSRTAQSDEAVVEKARRLVEAKRRLLWLMLLNSAMFLGLCGYFTLAGIRKIDTLDADKLNMGFIYGFALAVVWVSFGIIGALCLGKFLAGVSGDFRTQELLVCYHDRLRELGQLPDEKPGRPDGLTSGGQSIALS
jgi:hypothetical protein